MITLHHLAFSRSTRLIWLMEELGLPYDLVRHERDARFKAPPALRAIHPLGKAPVIQDGDLVLAESAVILTYINDRYGEGRLAPPPGSAEHWRHEEWLHYAESTAAFPIMTMRIGAITGGMTDALRAFVAPTLEATLDHISGRLAGRPYLMGEELTLADIQMCYLIEVAERTGLLGAHPALPAYLARLKARPAFQRAEGIGGPMMPPG
ncbi:glutathione S-transferase family protein [Starkeya koreensis]|uniref:Glutathione S-transferase family protein n=1 Tax=Ancylobacter koreensis TaxID=266121 RepID=A0ABT0DPS3_9HYPH|nr:glutathione S-transferase family protein [Ancylobacter koreensis]